MPDSYDNPWKEALEEFFSEFLALFFPEAQRRGPKRIPLTEGQPERQAHRKRGREAMVEELLWLMA